MKITKADKELIFDLVKAVNENMSREVFFDRVDRYVFEEMEDDYYTLTEETIKDIEEAQKQFKEGRGIPFDIDLFIKELEDEKDN